MAALFTSQPFLGAKAPIQELKPRNPRKILVVSSCRGGERVDGSSKAKKEAKQEEKSPRNLFGGVEDLGRSVKEVLGPRTKGDWRDVALMSLSFAVYVYISQQIVCTYCAWSSMFEHPRVLF